MSAVGRSVERKDGIGKATGAAKYADDLAFPGMIHGRTIRSTIARGILESGRVKGSVPGLTVVDHRDIPGRNTCYLIEQDQPFLVEKDIRHQAEPVLLLAHADREVLNSVEVDLRCRELEPLFDPERSDSVFKTIDIVKGDVEAALRRADRVIEGVYRTGHQEHVYIEPNGVIAVPEDGGVAIHGSMQCPFYVIKALRALLGESMHIRVVQTETGGGFGGKEEYPSMIAGHAALLALKSGKPVKIIYDRVEDMVATTKRHPSIVKHRTGVMNDGRIVAMDVDVLLDGGAYVTLSPVVLSRGTIHAAGPYRCDNTRIHGRAVMTNTPPNGAFRGFGAPQTEFAIEVHMERIAEVLGMDPVTLREMNALRPGDTTATGQVMKADCSAHMVLDEAVKRTDFRARRERY
jgi:CO/xanthine dehydrogenase Mo-binding subunit